jgi:hypothetical protein
LAWFVGHLVLLAGRVAGGEWAFRGLGSYVIEGVGDLCLEVR